MNSLTCYNCSKEIPDSSHFCPYCLLQIKCKNCNSSLLKDALGCAECGERITKETSYLTPLNQLEFEQKGDLKKFKATFTNEVGHALVETFGTSVVGSSSLAKKKPNPFIIEKIEGKNNTYSSLNTNRTEDIQVEDENIGDELGKIFKMQDDVLMLINPRLKQSGKMDNAIRLAILSLLAYEHAGNIEIERKTLTGILKASKLNMPDFSTWITRCDEIIRNRNKIQLSVPGRATAIEVLKEVADDSITVGKVSFTKSSRSSSKRKNNSSTSKENSVNNESGKIQHVETSNERGTNKSNTPRVKEAVTLIKELDLRPKDSKSFRDFYSEKKPSSAAEFNAVAVYYLAETLQTQEINGNHIYTCYKEVGKRPPDAFVQSLRDTASRNGYIDISNINDIKIPLRGKHFVEHDLPKQNVQK